MKMNDEFPKSRKAALLLPDADGYVKAMDKEMASHENRPTWNRVPLSVAKRSGKKILRSLWVLIKKYDEHGNYKLHKARLVADGHFQDRTEQDTYSPTVKLKSARIILSIAAAEDLVTFHADFETAFLFGVPLEEEIYMYPAPGYETYTPHGELEVYLLIESIYGLLQAALNWNKRIVRDLTDYGFQQLLSDPCVLMKRTTPVRRPPPCLRSQRWSALAASRSTFSRGRKRPSPLHPSHQRSAQTLKRCYH